MLFDLKNFRRENGLKQSDLQDILGVTQGFISRVENFKDSFPEAYYNKLLEKYGEENITKYIIPPNNIGNNHSTNTISGDGNSNIGNVNNHVNISLPEAGSVKIIKPNGEVETKTDSSMDDNEKVIMELRGRIKELESENNKLKADLISAKDKIIALLGG